MPHFPFIPILQAKTRKPAPVSLILFTCVSCLQRSTYRILHTFCHYVFGSIDCKRGCGVIVVTTISTEVPPLRTSFIRNDHNFHLQALKLTTSRFSTYAATYRSAYSYDYPLIFCVLRGEVVFEVYIKRQWAGCGGLGYMLDSINAEVAVAHP